MDYQIFTPPEHLRDLVQCFWTLESDPNAPIPENYFLMADSCPEIIFQYNEGFQAYSAQSARIRFQHSINDKFVVGNKVGFFGVRLYPHAVNQLLNIPANEVVNHVFDFSDLFRQEGTDLADQVYSAAGTPERIIRVSDYLTKRASGKKMDPVKYIVDQRYPPADRKAAKQLIFHRCSMSRAYLLNNLKEDLKALPGSHQNTLHRIDFVSGR